MTLSLNAAAYGLQSGTAVVGLLQTPGSQGATAMLNNDLSGRLAAERRNPTSADVVCNSS